MKRRIIALLTAAVLALALCACGSSSSNPSGGNSAAPGSQVTIPPVEDLTGVDTSSIPGLEDGVFTVGMECAYAPYNWTQMDDSNGAVPISN
ncbi:MAG: hypothetical protein ACI4OU_01205, partial [Candidatus Enterenecus sp.]